VGEKEGAGGEMAHCAHMWVNKKLIN
jgi:hypothetical protein